MPAEVYNIGDRTDRTDRHIGGRVVGRLPRVGKVYICVVVIHAKPESGCAMLHK